MRAHSFLDIDLFAGAGGLAFGLERAGFCPTTLCERDPYACRNLRRNTASAKPTLHGTVKETNIYDVFWDNITDLADILYQSDGEYNAVGRPSGRR